MAQAIALITMLRY